MGVVHPEDPDAPRRPKVDDLLTCIPQRHAGGLGTGPKVDRIDVLVLLGRVLGVGDRAVRTPVEPLGVVPDPRVVRRAVQRVVEGDFHPVTGRRPHQVVEIVERAELGVERGVPAFLGADGPGAPRVPRPGRERVVPPFAERVADGVNGRQVEDIEAQVSQPGDLAGRPPQPAEATGEQLVPGPDRGCGPVDPEGGGRRNGQVGRKLLPRQGVGDVCGQGVVDASGVVDALVTQSPQGLGDRILSRRLTVGRPPL